MAKGFNLTAEINLRGPSNLRQIAANIRKELGTVDATVKVKLDKAAERSILNTSNALARLNKELQVTAQASATTTTNISNLVGAMNNLGAALNGSNTSMAQIVSSAQNTTQQMAKLKKGTVEARSEMEEFGRQSALAVRRFAAFNFATGVIYGLFNAVSKATSEFIEFDRQLVRLTQITGESYEQLSRITDTVTGLSTGLGVASSDLIKISDTLAQAGFSARETDQALKALALTALAPSFDNLNDTVEGSIALMRQFKISTEDLDKALGSINAVAAGFAVEASDIITAIQRTGGVFAAASKGVSEGTDALNEFIAVFTSVRATTRESAETIATGLRTIFTRIQREDTIDALKEYGVNLLDVQGKFVGAYKAVQLLSEGLGKLDPRDTSFSRIVEELGGFRQIGKVLPLIQEFATAQQALGVAQRGQSSLALDAVKAQASLAVQFAKTRESFVALIRDIGNSDSFKTLVSLGLTLANTFIRVADVAKPLLPIITAIGAIKGAKALTSFVGGFVGGLRKVKPSGDTGPQAQEKNAEARAKIIADSYTDNSTALNQTTGALNNLTAAISPLTDSINNLNSGVLTQLVNEVTALNNNISNLPPGGGTGLNRGGVVRRFARGGSVPGSGDSDSVPALLTPGEFVVNKKAARAIGTDKLHSINRYAKGGLIAAKIDNTKATDGDTLNVDFTPESKPFNTLTRLEGWDAFETDDVQGFKIPEWQRKLGRAAAKVTKSEYENNNKKALDAFRQSGKMDNYGRPMFKDDLLGDKLRSLGLAMKYTGKGKAPTKQLETWGGYRNYFGFAPSQAPGLQGEMLKDDPDAQKKALGGLIQRLGKGGVAQRKVGYIDYDVIANDANKDIVEKGMKETGVTGPRLYTDYLTDLAVKRRKESSLDKLRAIYGVAGSGKTTLARGQGTDNAKLRQTERFPVLLPQDIQRATEILILSSTVSKKKLDEVFSNTDRTYTLSSSTNEERAAVKDRKISRDVTGIGLENRKPGSTSSVSTDSAVGEALLGDKLGRKSVVLGRTGSGKLRRKSGDELVEVIKKKIGFTWGGFSPMTLGHESIMDSAAAMGFSPEDFVYLVGANEGIVAGDKSSYRTAIFNQDARMLLAKAGAGARGATVLPKPRDFEVPQAFDVSEGDKRRVIVPAKGSTAFVADKTPKDLEKYKAAGYGVVNLERSGGISGTMVRNLIAEGDLAGLQKILSPGVYELISNNIGRIQNRANILPTLVEQVQQSQAASLQDIDSQIKAVGISRIDSKKVASDPDYAAKATVLTELREKRDHIKKLGSFEPYRLLDALAKEQPEKYGLDFNLPSVPEIKPLRTVKPRTQKASLGGIIQSFMAGGIAEESSKIKLSSTSVDDTATKNKISLQDAILAHLDELGGIDGVRIAAGIPKGDRRISSVLRRNSVKSGIALDEAGSYVDRALSRIKGQDLANQRNIKESKNKGLLFAAAGILGNPFAPIKKTLSKDLKQPTDVYITSGTLDPATALKVESLMGNSIDTATKKVSKQIMIDQILSQAGLGKTLFLDFDRTLALGADKLPKDDDKSPFAAFGDRDKVKSGLGGARLTKLGRSLSQLVRQQPELLPNMKILTARPQPTLDLIQEWLSSQGLPIPLDQFTGVGGPSVSEAQVAQLKASFLTPGSVFVDDSGRNTRVAKQVSKANKSKIKTFRYGLAPVTDDSNREGTTKGNLFERAIEALGGPKALKIEKGIDFPLGLQAAAKYFGIRGDIPTDAKRTINGPSTVEDNITSYLKAQGYKTGGVVTVYHGSNTGVNDSILKSFQEGGAKADIAQGYGQGAGFYVWSDKESAKRQAEMRVKAGLGSFAVVKGDTTGKPMVLTFKEMLDPTTWDLDYEMNKGSVVKWLVKNYDQIKDKVAPKLTAQTRLTGIKGVVNRDRGQGIMSDGIDIQDDMGGRSTIFSGTDGNIQEGKYIGQIMNRLQASDPEMVNSFENEFFKSPSLSSGQWDRLALKYVGSSPLKPVNIETFSQGGISKFASGGTVPALVSNGEAYVPPKLAKKIGYGKLSKMNQADRGGMGRFADGGISVFKGPGSGTSDSIPTSLPVGSFVIRAKATKALGLNKGGSVGISSPQRFEMGGEVLTSAEMQRLESDMSKVFESLPQQLKDALRNLDLPEVDTSTWNKIDISLRKVFLSVNKNVDTLGKDVVEAMRAMTTAGQNALQNIDLDRVRARQTEIANAKGYTQPDKDRMKEDTALAKDARGAVSNRKRKNREREEQGKAPFPELDLMEMMRSAVGRKPDPISVSASTPTAPTTPPRDTEFYRKRMNYSDISGQDTAISSRGMKYAGELASQDPAQVDALVKQLRDSFASVMSGIKTPSGKISAAGQSQSWANWDIGKQLFMSKNPDQSSDKYHLGNPMQDSKVMLQMVQRMVGYEVTGGGQREGKANNIPSFELVEIGAKAMAESLGKDTKALDNFLSVFSGITREDILGSIQSSDTGTASPTPTTPPPGVPPVPSPPVPPIIPPTSSGSGSPPVPPSGPPKPPGDFEAAIQSYMMEMETAAKAVKIQTYQAQRLAGATATEAKARADAAAQAAAQAVAQQRLIGATAEETTAIAEAITRINKVRGGVTLSRDDMQLPAQALAGGGVPEKDNPDYAAATKANIDAINSMTENFTKFSVVLAASEGIADFVGLIGNDSMLGKSISSLVSSLTSTSALFIAANGAIETFTNVLSSEKTADYLNNFSDYLTSASRKLTDFSSGFSGSAAKGVLDKIASGLGKGGGLVGKLAGNLPQIASGLSGALSSLAGPVGAVVTGANLLASTFISVTDSIRQAALDEAIKSFDDNLKYAEQSLNSYSRNTVDNAQQLQLANASILNVAKAARAQADISSTNPKWGMTNIVGETLTLGGGGAENRAQRADILDKKGMGAYVSSLLDMSGRTQQQYMKEFAPQKAIETAEKFKKPAELQQKVFEERFKKGETSSDIMKSPDWEQQTEILARSNAAIEEQIRLIDADLSMSKSARDAKKQEIMSMAAANSVREQEIRYIKNKNAEEASDASSKLLYGLDRMLSNMEQSINTVTHSLNKLADQTDLLKASMTGEAKIGSTRLDATNVIQNPNMYTADERSKAAGVGAEFFGPQAKDIKGLLQFGPDLENTLMSTINRTIQEDPNASSGKIEARITQNIEKELGNLNIDEGLKKTLSKDIGSTISESRKSGEDKKGFDEVFSKTSSLGKTVDATKKAQEASLKALEFYQNAVNSYAQSMNEAVALQISANEKMRRADDIRVRGEMSLAKTLGKNISLENTTSVARASATSQAGTSDPRQIMNNIGRLEMTRQNQQASADAAAQKGLKGGKDLMSFNSQLSSTTMQLRNNYSALKSLAESTEVADAALAKISEAKAKNEAGLGILERFISSTPKEQAKLNQSFERLDRNMNGQTNNMWDSIRVQEAYNEALKNGASMQEAQEAADSAAAQDRGDTMEAFKMLAPYLGDNQNQLKANMLESMMAESGVEMSPMFNQVLEGLRNPEGDPQMAEAINQYRQATALQAQANQYLAMLDNGLAQQIGAQAQTAFVNALNGVQQANANANAKDTLSGINNINNQLRTGVTKVSTVSGSAPVETMATGGVVEYRAVGGSIFKPKGSDTVPAMLTPGEFVVNKQAASKHGPLLSAINNGYSKGGSVKYYEEGGWVSSRLKDADAGRFDSAVPNTLYTKYEDFSRLGSDKDVMKNIDDLKSNAGTFQFIKPYSVPTFNGTNEKLYTSYGNPIPKLIEKQINGGLLGVIPDFTLSRVTSGDIATGAAQGAMAGAKLGAGATGAAAATAVAASSRGQNSAQALLGDGMIGSAAGWIWEAMKFIPGLGGFVSGIDAFKKLFIDGDIIGGGLEALNALFSFIPIPGASLLGKVVTGALKFLTKFSWAKRLGGLGKYIPQIFEKFGGKKIYDTIRTKLEGPVVDLIKGFIPKSVMEKLTKIGWGQTAKNGTAVWAGGQTQRATRQVAERLSSTAAGATMGSVAGAGVGVTGTVVGGIQRGASLVASNTVMDKLKDSMVSSTFTYPMGLSDITTASDLIDNNPDVLTLEEAQAQLVAMSSWMNALKEASEWEKVKQAPEATANVTSGGMAGYSKYSFGPKNQETGNKFMFAKVGKPGEEMELPQGKFTNVSSMLKFTPGGYPTLGSDQASNMADSFYQEKGYSFEPNAEIKGGIEDFSILQKTLEEYYNSLREVDPLNNNTTDFNPKFWTKDAPAKRTENRRAAILKALVTGDKVSYAFDKSQLTDASSLYGWKANRPTENKTPSGENKSESADKLTVYGTAMRPMWKSIIANETAEQAIKDKLIWGGEPDTGFLVENKLIGKTEPLPWTTDPSLISNEALQVAQANVEQSFRDKLGLDIAPVTSYNKMVDLPESKRKIGVFFNYRKFSRIPLMDPEMTEFDEDAVKSYLTDGTTTPVGGLFVTDRSTKGKAGSITTVNPFQTLNQEADKNLPYYSSDSALDEAVQQWAQSNFDLIDFSLAGVKLATNYNPIVAEKAFKPSTVVKSAIISRKKGPNAPTGPESDVGKFLKDQQALFYADDYKIGDNIAYNDAQNIIASQLPAISESMQLAAVNDTSMSKDERRKKIQQEAANISFKKEHIPLLADVVWKKVKYTDLSMTDGLKTSSDWLKAASEDGMSPPEDITNQEQLLDAIDYLSWVKSKVLQVTQKAQKVSKEKLEEVQNLGSEAVFGQYMSAARFMGQLAAQEGNANGSNSTISQASERLYSKYIGKIDEWTTKERIGTGSTKGMQKSTDKAEGKGFEVGTSTVKESKFWNIPKILSEDKGFSDYILGFAAQQRGAQRFDQLITGNNNAKLNDIQTNAIKDMYNSFTGPDKAVTDDKSGTTKTMKAMVGNQLVDLPMPTDINSVKEQFMNDSQVYEPEYRDLLGNTLMQLGDKYATKWSNSGDPGTSEWSKLWNDYSAKLENLRDFLVYRDELLIRPIAKKGDNSLYPPAVLPAITNGILPTISQALASANLPMPEIPEGMVIDALKDPASFGEFLNQQVFKIPVGMGAEDYEQRDKLAAVKASVRNFYNSNFSPTAMPRVFTEEGNNLWNEIASLYPKANEAWSMFSGGMSGEGVGGAVSDATVQLKSLDEVYNPNQMPSAQGTLYGFYYNKNKKFGTNNTIAAMEQEKEAATPKADVNSTNVVQQAVNNAGSQSDVGMPKPPDSPAEVAKNVGVSETETPTEPVRRAKGGLIYRALGGKAPINWTPKGTDTVPAMLTPGEYVVNRSSTDKYLPILEAINNGNASQSAIASAVQSGGTPAASYASRGGRIAPRYFSGGGLNGEGGGVSNSYTMGFDSATLAAIKQFDDTVKAFGAALSELNIGNIKLDQSALTALGDFATKFDQFTQSLLKLNIPPVISITGQHEVNVQLNGAAIFSTMEQRMKQMIVDEIDNAFNQLSKDNEGSISVNYRPKR